MPSSRNVAPINPLLTNFQIGYRNKREGYTADFVFPNLMTGGKITGTYIDWDKGNNFQVLNTKRADKSPAALIDFENGTGSFATREYAARHGFSKRTERSALNPVKLPTKAAQVVADTLLLDKQRLSDALITTGNISQNTTLSGTAQWNDPASNPVDDIVTAIKTIEKATGVKPNRMVVGGEVWWDGLQNNAEVVARVQSTTNLAGIQFITPALLGQVFGLDLRVASAVYNTAKEGQTASLDYSFGKKALIFFSDPSADDSTPTFGLTFMAQDFQAKKYFDDELDTTFVESSIDYDTKIVKSDCGYLIDSAVA